MKTMSAIYTKVRHRLNDDWAYGNGKNHVSSQSFSFDFKDFESTFFQMWTVDLGIFKLKNVL